MRMRFITKSVIMGFMVFMLFGCDNKADNGITVKWGETLAESHPSTQMAIRAGKEITERTQGRVKVEVYTGGQLGASKEMVEAMQIGAQEMLTEGVAQFQMLPSLEILEAPYIWKSPETFDKVVNSDIIEEFNQMGIDPVQFGLIMVLNLMIGTITPPVGVVLSVTANVANVSFDRVAKATAPFLIPLIIVLLLVTYVPYVTLFLPSLFN